MKSLEESVVESMDGSSKELFQFLPFIMQDLWKMGTSPTIINKLINTYTSDYAELQVLDLGCGKGIVSIELARKFHCSCHGIDGVKEFIGVAKKKAKEFSVEHLCHFETDDVRKRIKDLGQYDVIILGSIGPVFGNYHRTFSQMGNHLKTGGLIIIDDSYIADDSDYSHPQMVKKNIILQQVKDSGLIFIAEMIIQGEDLENSDKHMFEKVINRCNQLIEMYPEDSQLFLEYIIKQQEENEILEKKVICSTMVIKKPEYLPVEPKIP